MIQLGAPDCSNVTSLNEVPNTGKINCLRQEALPGAKYRKVYKEMFGKDSDYRGFIKVRINGAGGGTCVAEIYFCG